MGIAVSEVRTGRAYRDRRASRPQASSSASPRAVLANGVIESVHFEPFVPERVRARARATPFKLRHVPLRDLTDEQLTKLSREGHLFLSLAEMKAIQDYLPRAEPRADRHRAGDDRADLERALRPQDAQERGRRRGARRDRQDDRPRQYGNLIKDTIFNSTQELMSAGQERTSACRVFKDNAGVIAFDDTDAVCFKVETHNHPSAIEPYGGSATGVGRRDPRHPRHRPGRQAHRQHRRLLRRVSRSTGRMPPGRRSLPKGVIHPRRILQQVVAGVRDYGNRMGIPTVNGAVYFDDRYLGNPLVFCGCVGLIPRNKIEKARAAGRRDRGHGRPHRPRRHPRRDVLVRRADRHARRRVLPRRADRQRDHREEGDRRDPAGARPRACSPPSPTAARAGSPAPSARWARRSARPSSSTRCR